MPLTASLTPVLTANRQLLSTVELAFPQNCMCQTQAQQCRVGLLQR